MNKLLCGIDIGGTKIDVGLVNGEGRLIRVRSSTSHTCLNEECLLDFAADMVKDLCRDVGVGLGDLEGVAVGMAGHMRGASGVSITTSNLKGFKNYPVAAEMERRLGIRAILENDANCQAWAEHRLGAGRGHEDMVFITVSTGIGAGIIINNRLFRGQSGTAGEFGHTIIEPKSEVKCTCGNFGCFMSHACTLNLEELVQKKARQGTPTRMRLREDEKTSSGKTRPTGSYCRVDGKLIHIHAEKGDDLALSVINEYADYMGILLYNIFQIFNPPVIVLGGGLMNWGCGYFERMQDKFLALAGDMLYDPISIVRAEVKECSGVVGAALLLQETR